MVMPKAGLNQVNDYCCLKSYLSAITLRLSVAFLLNRSIIKLKWKEIHRGSENME